MWSGRIWSAAGFPGAVVVRPPHPLGVPRPPVLSPQPGVSCTQPGGSSSFSSGAQYPTGAEGLQGRSPAHTGRVWFSLVRSSGGGEPPSRRRRPPGDHYVIYSWGFRLLEELTVAGVTTSPPVQDCDLAVIIVLHIVSGWL